MESDGKVRRLRLKRFKPSFLHTEVEEKASLKKERAALRKPLEVPLENVVPWMNAYNPYSREVLLHQAAIRAKIRRSPPTSCRKLASQPSSPFSLRQSASQSLLPRPFSLQPLSPQVKEPRASTSPFSPVLMVQGRKHAEKPELHSDPVSFAGSIDSAGLKDRRSAMRSPGARDHNYRSQMKYFNAAIIPEKPARKVTISEIRAYMFYLEQQRFR